ncbi:hypothetical protein TrRE_jg1524 [Triparma retinervis]|uniref:Uncharacterized protein n=1 Tax=Triparma retinervis TaxID=2557542 RepID=A0A9W7AM09_9STRA|nr:hypothetical protein TrRE_jg1524 [Triparma retinervis]
MAFLLLVLYTISGFVKSKQMKNNASCQTLVMSAFALILVMVFQGGYAFTMNGWDLDFVFHNDMLSLLFSIAFTCWGVTMLNIAIAWIEVVEKSQKKGQKGNTAMYKRVIYTAMFVLSAGVFACLFVIGSAQLAGGVVLLGLIFIAMVFYFGGKKLGGMLRGGKPKDANATEMSMDVMVDSTAMMVGKGSLCTLMCVMMFIMFTNGNVWLSTIGIEGGMQLLLFTTLLVIRFIRFGGRRAMAKAGLKPVFSCEAAKIGKLDKDKTSSSVAPSSVE